MNSEMFSAEYIEDFLAGYFDELINFHKPFLRDLGVNINDAVTPESISNAEREKVENVVLQIEEIMHDRVNKLEIYKNGNNELDRVVYFYKENGLKATPERIDGFNKVWDYGAGLDVHEKALELDRVQEVESVLKRYKPSKEKTKTAQKEKGGRIQ